MAVDDADELLDAHLPQGAWDTVGGLVLDLAGHVPDEGEAVEVDGFRLVAERVQGRRIDRVRIERAAPVASPTPTAVGGLSGAHRVRHRRRPAQRRQVHPGQPDGRHQGVDHLAPAQHHPPSRPRGPAPPDAQVVFVDTPGLHRPRTALASG